MVATLAILIAVLCALASLGYNLLVSPWTYDSNRFGVLRHSVAGSTQERYGFAADEFRLIRDTGLFDVVVASQRVPVAFGDGSGSALPRTLVRTTPDALRVTAAQPLLGRFVEPGDSGAGNRVVLSHELWQDRFGASPQVLGQMLQLDGSAYEIVGVMPPRFHFMGGDFWAAHDSDLERDDSPDARLVLNVALPRGTRVDQLGSRLQALAQRLVDNAAPDRYPRGWQITALRVIDAVTGPQRPAVILVVAGAGLLLLLGVLNVAALLVARQIADSAMLATRRALGESRRRAALVAFIESLVIASLAVALAVPLGQLLFDRFVGLIAMEWVPRELQGAFAYSTPALAVLPLIALGVAAALTALRLPGLLRMDARTAMSGNRSGARRGEINATRWLSGLQIAMAAAILVGALAMGSGAQSLLSRDLGFDPQATQHATLSLPRAGIADGVARLATFERMAEELQRRGAHSVAFTGAAPMQRYSRSGTLSEASDVVLDEAVPVDLHAVHGRFADALGLRVREGRMIDVAIDHDRAEPVAVITRSLAGRLAPEGSAVGRSLVVASAGGEPVRRRVVGVVDDVRHESPLSTIRPTLYVPYAQDASSMAGSGGQVALVVRWQPAEPGLAPAMDGTRVQAAVAAVNPWIAVGEVTTMTARAERSIAGVTLASRLFVGFALLGLLLASMGIACVAELAVARQRHGMAVRAALGASPRRLLAQVMRGSLVIAVPAALIGTLAAWMLDGVLAGAVQGRADIGPAVVAGTAAVLLACALLATILPARKAMRIQPLSVLKGS